MSELLSERQEQSSLVSQRQKYMEEIQRKRLERQNRGALLSTQNSVERIIIPTRKVGSASSDSSKDEGIHSTGDKAEDDITEDDFSHVNTDAEDDKDRDTEDDEDEGRESLTEAESTIDVNEQLEEERPDGADVENEDAVATEEDEERPENTNEDAEVTSEFTANKDDDAGSAGYQGDVDDTPGQSMQAETYKEMLEEAKEDPSELPEEEENKKTETDAEEAKFGEESIASVEENAEVGDLPAEELAKNEEDTSEAPLIARTSINRKSKRKMSSTIDLDKVTANRKPISIRTAPLPMPVSSKTENKNFKPQLKSTYEIQRQYNAKLRARNKRNELKNKIRRESETGGNMSSGEGQPNTMVTVELATPSPSAIEGTHVQFSESPLQAGMGDKEFLNPHMDHSLERPVAPHQRYRSPSRYNESASKMAVKGGPVLKSEVWIPEENQLYIYSYSSEPRLLHIKRLGGKRVATTPSTDTDPSSSFRIRNRSGRVIRGTNFGKDGAPKWNPYFAYARMLSDNYYDYSFLETEEMQRRREEFRNKMRERVQERRANGYSSLYASYGSSVGSFSSVRRTTNHPQYNVSKNFEFRTYTHLGDSLHLDQSSSSLSNYTSRYGRRGSQTSSIGTQVWEEELGSSESAEEAIIKALVSNIVRESAVEVASEAEADGAKMEEFAARRLSTVGEPAEKEAASDEAPEDEIRKDPEGEEAAPEEEEAAPDSPEEEAAPENPEEEAAPENTEEEEAPENPEEEEAPENPEEEAPENTEEEEAPENPEEEEEAPETPEEEAAPENPEEEEAPENPEEEAAPENPEEEAAPENSEEEAAPETPEEEAAPETPEEEAPETPEEEAAPENPEEEAAPENPEEEETPNPEEDA